jgi:arylformamidase
MSRYVDLTLTLRPSLRGIEWESAATVEKEGWNARLLHLYSHSGTHMDSPKHFNCG